MKFTTKATLCLIVLWSALTSTIKDPSNPPVGNTGAPGETTCQRSGCHDGGSYTGTVAISGVPDTVVANTSYTITLTNTSNAVRSGFQMLCLDAASAQCGSFTVGTGTSIGTSGTKQYIRQSAYKTLSSGSTSWTFTWKAPASVSSSPITFYFVSLCANGNGSTSGDNVLKASKSVLMKSTTTASDEIAESISVKLYPNPTTDFINVDIKDVQDASLILTDMSGRTVLRQKLSDNSNKISVSALAKGYYNAQIKAGEKSVSKRFIVD